MDHGTVPERVTTGHSPAEIADDIARWIEGGGAQAADGAYSGWLDARTGALSPPYPEITGYVLGFFATAADSPSRRRRGNAAATWLASRVEAGDFSARPEKTGGAVYTFDVAMLAHGLIRYGVAVDSPRYVDAGLRSVDYLLATVDADGELPCIVPGTASSRLPSSWSTTGRAHLLKVVQALLDAAEFGVQRAHDAAYRIVRDSVVGRRNRGAAVPLLTCPGAGRVSLHALCYAAEGLWIWGTRERDGEAIALSRWVTEWVWRHRLPDGGFPGHTTLLGDAVDHKRQSDVLSQAIRLAELHQIAHLDRGAATAWLTTGLWRGDGGAAVYYWPDEWDRHLNVWASLFAVQALRLRAGTVATLAWPDLV